MADTSPEEIGAAPTITSGGCEMYRPYVERYEWHTSTVLAIMRAESGCMPHAVGDNYIIGGIHAPSCGLLQVRTLPGRPDCETLKDPASNIAAAYRVYTNRLVWDSDGFNAWSTYLDDSYLEYL